MWSCRSSIVTRWSQSFPVSYSFLQSPPHGREPGDGNKAKVFIKYSCLLAARYLEVRMTLRQHAPFELGHENAPEPLSLATRPDAQVRNTGSTIRRVFNHADAPPSHVKMDNKLTCAGSTGHKVSDRSSWFRRLHQSILEKKHF